MAKMTLGEEIVSQHWAAIHGMPLHDEQERSDDVSHASIPSDKSVVPPENEQAIDQSISKSPG